MASKDHEKLFEQVLHFKGSSYIVLTFLLAISAIYIGVVLYQYHVGLRVTGLNVPSYWGIYIASFVYFIGLSHAGTLISAILRVTGAEWRRPVTRLAEAITVFVLIIGVANVFTDLGRPIRGLIYLPEFGRAQSPLFWDICSILTYLAMSTIFLHVALIPDIAHLRRKKKNSRLSWVYEVLSLGFQGTKKHWKQYERTMLVLSVLVIPVAVSVHTVVSFVFSMTPQPLWNETVFGPYFVTGALFSGVGSILVAMYLLRRFYGLGEYLDRRRFDNMGKLLLSLAIIWFYFMLAEHLTTYYGFFPEHMAPLSDRLFGRYQPWWLLMMVTNFVVPFILLVYKRTIKTTTLAGFSVMIGMYLERILIVTPTLTNPMLPLTEPRKYGLYQYIPTWVELTTIVGGFAVFTLLYYLFTKMFPIVPFSEVTEEDTIALEEENKYENPHLGYKPNLGISWMQKAFLGFFILLEATIIAIILNGVRNAYIFGTLIQQIRDISMPFGVGLVIAFIPVHLAVTYSVVKMVMVFWRSEEEEGATPEKSFYEHE